MLKPLIIKRRDSRATASKRTSATVERIASASERIPRAFLEKWVTKTAPVLLKEKLGAKARSFLLDASEVTIVFISEGEIRRLNREFRGKDEATDVLSFAPTDEGSLGELALCLSVIKRQAREHDLSVNEELGYMVLHGVLHLLGYDHELSARDSKRMLSLQDRVFETLLASRSR